MTRYANTLKLLAERLEINRKLLKYNKHDGNSGN
jgi:hypothetical protein